MSCGRSPTGPRGRLVIVDSCTTGDEPDAEVMGTEIEDPSTLRRLSKRRPGTIVHPGVDHGLVDARPLRVWSAATWAASGARSPATCLATDMRIRRCTSWMNTRRR